MKAKAMSKGFNKAPYRYSELYTRWRKVVGTSDAAAIGAQHSRLHLGAQYDEVMAAIRRHRRHSMEDE